MNGHTVVAVVAGERQGSEGVKDGRRVRGPKAAGKWVCTKGGRGMRGQGWQESGGPKGGRGVGGSSTTVQEWGTWGTADLCVQSIETTNHKYTIFISTENSPGSCAFVSAAWSSQTCKDLRNRKQHGKQKINECSTAHCCTPSTVLCKVVDCLAGRSAYKKYAGIHKISNICSHKIGKFCFSAYFFG